MCRTQHAGGGQQYKTACCHHQRAHKRHEPSAPLGGRLFKDLRADEGQQGGGCRSNAAHAAAQQDCTKKCTGKGAVTLTVGSASAGHCDAEWGKAA